MVKYFDSFVGSEKGAINRQFENKINFQCRYNLSKVSVRFLKPYRDPVKKY